MRKPPALPPNLGQIPRTEYYAHNPRQPTAKKLAPWVAAKWTKRENRARRLQAPKDKVSPERSSSNSRLFGRLS